MATPITTPPPTVTSAFPSPTATDTGNGATSSPLLFFVALGFVSLFTRNVANASGRIIHEFMVCSLNASHTDNNRIIVGVKYCFRYSQRNRRGGQPAEEEVDLATLHPFVGLTHPVQRRRREKKLLKIDEVNERFPVMTYKAWRAQRERQGLSSEGGIAPNQTVSATPFATTESAPESTHATPLRVATPILDQEITQATPPDTLTEKNPRTEVPEKEKAPLIITPLQVEPEPEPPETPITPVASSSKHRDSTLSMDADDEDHNHLPDELLGTSGDNCAICIELLEDDDEVRGLTCGHCYHQSCIDPWFTQRKASCPLCKADYYIPKPPPEPTDASTNNNTSTSPAVQTSTERIASPPVTTEHWAPLFLRPFRPVLIPTSTSTNGYGSGYPSTYNRYQSQLTTTEGESPPFFPRASRWRIQRIDRPSDLRSEEGNNNNAEDSVSPTRSWRRALRHPFWRSRGDENTPSTAVDANTLERGEGSS